VRGSKPSNAVIITLLVKPNKLKMGAIKKGGQKNSHKQGSKDKTLQDLDYSPTFWNSWEESGRHKNNALFINLLHGGKKGVFKFQCIGLGLLF